jgi:hypothetical protein
VAHFKQSNFLVSKSSDGSGSIPANAIRFPHLGQRGRSNASIIEGGGLGIGKPGQYAKRYIPALSNCQFGRRLESAAFYRARAAYAR